MITGHIEENCKAFKSKRREWLCGLPSLGCEFPAAGKVNYQGKTIEIYKKWIDHLEVK